MQGSAVVDSCVDRDGKTDRGSQQACQPLHRRTYAVFSHACGDSSTCVNYPARSSFAKAWDTGLPGQSVSKCLVNCMWRVLRTLLALAVFEQLHALESGSTAEDLVRQFGLVVGVLVPSILLIDLVMGVFGFSW